MTKILIVGLGKIGQGLGVRLIAAGHDVLGLRRQPPENRLKEIKVVTGDIRRARDVESLETDFDHVIFSVAADRREEASYRAIYDIGLGHLLDLFSTAARKPQWIFVSSTTVYGQSQGEWVDEGSPTAPNRPTGNIILQAEQRVLANRPENIVVRFSGIYGPGREGLLRRTKNTESVQVNPPYYTNRIHQDDCVGVLHFLLEKQMAGDTLDRCYVASDDAPAPKHEVMWWLADRMHCPRAPAKPATKEMSQNKRCSNKRLKSLGFRFEYPTYREGYLPLVRSLWSD
ncbi:MAG: SDR family oxidoreductase [Nitrospiria bacterium]